MASPRPSRQGTGGGETNRAEAVEKKWTETGLAGIGLTETGLTETDMLKTENDPGGSGTDRFSQACRWQNHRSTSPGAGQPSQRES